MAITELEKQKIIADYAECQNFSEVARNHGISRQTISRIINSADENVAAAIVENKEKNSATVIEHMDEQTDIKKRLLDKILVAMESKADSVDTFTSIKDLATAYGIIVDKELKILEIKARQSSGFDAETINQNILSVVNLINNPAKGRNIEDWE